MHKKKRSMNLHTLFAKQKKLFIYLLRSKMNIIMNYYNFLFSIALWNSISTSIFMKKIRQKKKFYHNQHRRRITQVS